ncbi:hypothetical protein QGM71_21235 [Virgibacillus sp. C22-A2]|uniref:Uncharacterized protein n=1 Tax=Virgibacillus tibetensis TaxID=3042313 RepID=A0ABU6KL87_9BACI|nr:hypothetical protein [Virgibacillus sp. C22-A2]
MSKNNTENIAPVVVGAVCGFSLGWIARQYNTKRLKLEGNKPLFDTLKSFERKVYADGFRRAGQLKGIKQDIHDKVAE